MFVNLDTTFGAFANVARPFIQETISETPPTLDVGTEALPVIRPFLTNSAGLFNDLQPGVDAFAANSPAIADALEVGAPVLRDSPDFNERAWRRPPRPCASLNDDADARARHRPPARDFHVLDPDPALHHAGADGLQLRRDPLRQPAEPVQPGPNGGPGTWQRAAGHHRAAGPEPDRPAEASPPNNEGAPSSAPANGGGNRWATSSTRTPTRTRPRPARSRSARPATRPDGRASR